MPFNINQSLQPQQNNQTPINPVVSGLFKAIDPKNINNFLHKGSLIAFNYSMWVHDPYPLVVVTDFIQGQRLRGVNLHYLTFPYIKTILRTATPNPSFSYGNIRGDKYIVSAFRTYKWNGIRQFRMLDSNFILTVMASVRTFDPTQIKAIKNYVQQQINREIQAKAGPIEGNING